MARKRKRRSKRKKLWSKQSEFTRKDGSVVTMDSTWEVMMANRLNELEIKWIRDPKMKLEYKTRGGRSRNYIPDFYLPDLDIYIEVKGYWTDAAKHKMKDIIKRNPGKICILESLAEIGSLTKDISARSGSLEEKHV
jgi:predicted nuclease of restriction endonuclease-like RecB superfamily